MNKENHYAHYHQGISLVTIRNVFLYLAICLFGYTSCATGQKPTVSSNDNKIYFDFADWKQLLLSEIESQYNALGSDQRINYQAYYLNLIDVVKEKRALEYQSFIDTALQKLEQIPKSATVHILEYYLEGETSELTHGLYWVKNDACRGVVHYNDDKWGLNTDLPNCGDFSKLSSLKTVWEKEPKVLTGYAIITTFKREDIELNFLLAPSIWQMNLIDTFY